MVVKRQRDLQLFIKQLETVAAHCDDTKLRAGGATVREAIERLSRLRRKRGKVMKSLSRERAVLGGRLMILILQHDGGGYDTYTVSNDACVLVPDDFTKDSLVTLRQEWKEKTWAPKELRGNKISKRNYETVSFNEWLAGKFESLSFIESCN